MFSYFGLKLKYDLFFLFTMKKRTLGGTTANVEKVVGGGEAFIQMSLEDAVVMGRSG